MKIVQFHGDRRVSVEEAPEPEPSDDFAVIKVMSSTICGTEFSSYTGLTDVGPMGNAGHEATGIVWKTAPGSRLTEGARVAMYPGFGERCGKCANCYRGVWLRCLNAGPQPDGHLGTHAQYVRRREDYCLELPDDISFEQGALLVDCVGTPYRGIRRMGVNGFDTVLITGMGPLGASAAMLCRKLGARIIATEVNDARLDRAPDFGVDHAINPTREDALARVMELTGGRGVDKAIDFTGYPEPQNLCLDAARGGGMVGFLGLKYEAGPDGPVPRATPVRVLDQLLIKEMTLISSWCVTPDQVMELFGLVREGLPVDRLITHRFGIDDAATAYETTFGGPGTKVMIDPWAE